LMVRVNISRPSQSVPNKCSRLGGTFLLPAPTRRLSLLSQKLSIRTANNKPEEMASIRTIFFRSFRLSCILSIQLTPSFADQQLRSKYRQSDSLQIRTRN